MKIERITAIWCPSCLLMKSRWENIEKEFSQIEFVDYDYDFDEDIVKTRDVGKKLPVCILYKSNQEIARVIGEKTEKELREILEEYVK